MSSWPLISDFSRILKTPKVAFRDPALRECTVEMNELGQPKPRSGNFATVFRAYRPDGSEFAVRVFNRAADERRERYQEVSEYLEDRPVSSLVKFEYDERGIRSASDGKRYPLVTMEWVPGLTLFEWTRARCHEGYAEALSIAADVWLQLVRELSANDVVHGDLQHGNVLVSAQGHFKLVDYDCMCVPALLNRRNLEIGMEPYQHPGRTAETPLFAGLDNFSALVIYVALRALAASPQLWMTYVDSQAYDKLLFRKQDFENPNASYLRQELMHSPDEQVRDLTHYLFELLRYDLYNIPPIDEVLLWCNSLDQLLSARDWDTAVQLVQRMSASEPIPAHLQSLVDQAQRRVACREALEKTLESGDEHQVQRCYVPDLLDDYPAAAALVEQARQAGSVMQILEVLRAARQFNKWDLLVETWTVNELLLDKRASAKEFKGEVRKIRTAQALHKFLEDPYSDDQTAIEAWQQIASEGGHPVAAPLEPVIRGRMDRQQRVNQLRQLVDNAPTPPTVEHDKQVAAAWKKEYFDGWNRIPKLREHFEKALARLKTLARLRSFAGTCTPAGEQALAVAMRELPETYDPQIRERAELARRRLQAHRHFQKTIAEAPSHKAINWAWDALKEIGGEGLASQDQRRRIDTAARRASLIESLSQLSDTWAPYELDQRILALWDEEVLKDCDEAKPFVGKYSQAKARHGLVERIRQALDEKKLPEIERCMGDPLLHGYPLPGDLNRAVKALREQAKQSDEETRRRLSAALSGNGRKEFYELFDAAVIGELCEQLPHHQGVVIQWIESEILPLDRSGLKPVEEDGLEKITETHYKARWIWPQPRIANRCRIVVCPKPPKPNTNLDDLQTHSVFTIDRSLWESSGQVRDVAVNPDWVGAHVLVWAIVDAGFQTFNTEPLELGRIEAEPEEKPKRWSIFGRGKEK